MINTKDIIRKKMDRKKMISIRIPIGASRFMKEKNYSPTAIFMESLKDLGFKPE